MPAHYTYRALSQLGFGAGRNSVGAVAGIEPLWQIWFTEEKEGRKWNKRGTEIILKNGCGGVPIPVPTPLPAGPPGVWI